MYIPINIAGGTYQHKSRPLSAQRTVNFWPQQQSGAGMSEYVLESFPGLRLFSSGQGADRGMIEHRDVLYKVSGTTLESISRPGVRTALGTITGDARCVMAGLGSSLVIVAGGNVWEWNGSTLTQGNSAAFESPDAVAVLNNQAIYDGSGGRFCVSDVGEPLTINALNYATAESKADNLIRPYAFLQNVYLFGEQTIETWWNSGEGNPPFDRMEGGLLEIGLGALHSVANNDQFIYFLGDDRNVYRLSAAGIESGFTPQPLIREFTTYATVSDAIGWCISFQSRQFYFLKFPSENKTFVYPEGGQWFQISSSAFESGGMPGRYRGNSYAYAYGKHLIASESGNIYEFRDDVYDEDGDVIKRVRDTAPLHGGLVNLPGRDITLTEFRLIMETGIGLPSDPGATPRVMLSFSTDGGRTFSTETWGDVGALGQFQTEVAWNGLNVTGQSIIIRISTSDAVYYSLHSAGAEIEIGI